MQSHKTAGIWHARKSDLLAIGSRGKFRIWENTPKSDNLSKRRIHDAENTSIMQIIVIRCVKCPHLSRLSDLGVFRRDRIYR